MNTYKSLGLAGLAVASLFAVQAQATPTTCPSGTQGSPVCIATTGGDGPGTSLQEQVDSMTTHGPGLDVYNDQVSPSAFWSIGATNNSENSIAFELAGNADQNTFGIFDPSNPNNRLQLFTGPAGAGWSTNLQDLGNGKYGTTYKDGNGIYQGQNFATFGVANKFGYYLETPNGIFYSSPALNEMGGNAYPNGMPHMAAYEGDGSSTFQNGSRSGIFLPNEFLLAWEDSSFSNSDMDYNDFVVLVESVRPVPEPAVLASFGLGLLLIGGFVGMRRRENA